MPDDHGTKRCNIVAADGSAPLDGSAMPPSGRSRSTVHGRGCPRGDVAWWRLHLELQSSGLYGQFLRSVLCRISRGRRRRKIRTLLTIGNATVGCWTSSSKPS